jgi:hypothetical protein
MHVADAGSRSYRQLGDGPRSVQKLESRLARFRRHAPIEDRHADGMQLSVEVLAAVLAPVGGR